MPASIGPYRVLRELGSGGMGSVYLADQTAPVRRQVALKVVKLGMDTREVVARFQAERQALALMNHPNIAQVFDAGLTREGRPFFVMEFVPGTMLTSFCDEHRMATEARVQLMSTICRAVQHAHDRGFIHRDLKPSNVLVAEHEGGFMPKIIDFGIAKATAAVAEDLEARAASLHTRADQVLGTPEYMSPEQMCSGGLDVDTRTDVYSLGVTLYELLCGELPFDSRRLRSVGRTELERILREELPTQPSRRLSQVDGDIVAARGGERATVQRTIAGGLDWITLKALAKHREQRYPSALALAEDLDRWLRHEPVQAAPPGTGYRLRKFLRRHRVSVTAASLVFASLVGGLVVSLQATQAARAAEARESAALGDMRRYFGLARDAVGNLVDVANEELVDVPQAEGARRKLLADALQFYSALRERQPADVELQVERLEALERIGRLQRQLGKTEEALATLTQCTDEVRRLQTNATASADAAHVLIRASNELARVQSSLGREEDSQQSLRAALAALAEARTGPQGTPFDYDAQEARLLASLAVANEADAARAIELYEQAFAVFARSPHATSPANVRSRARLTAQYATALTRVNRLVDAGNALTDAMALLRTVASDDGVDAREDEAKLQVQIATVMRRLDRRGEARAAWMRAIELYGTLAADHPTIPSYGDQMAAGWHFLSQLDDVEAKHAESLAAARKAAELRGGLVERFPQDRPLALRYAQTLLQVFSVELRAWQQYGGDRTTAMTTLGRAIAVVDRLHAEQPDDLEVLFTFCGVHTTNGAMHATRREYEAALNEHLAVQKALSARLPAAEGNADMHYQLAIVGNNLFQTHYLMDQVDDALAAAETALRHCERGLAIDARHLPMRELLPQVVGRVASARFATDDYGGGVATLQDLCRREAWGADAREQGCLLLANELTRLEHHEQRQTWLVTLANDLGRAITARGTLQDALRRPAQKSGMSHVRSRLRDFDLRIAQSRVLGELDRRQEQAAVLDELVELDRTLPELAVANVRELFTQRIGLAIVRPDAAAAVALADELLTRVGEHGGANYRLAVLLTSAAAATSEAEVKERAASKAVQCLRRAIDDHEVEPTAAQHAGFASLRDRSDYQAILGR